MRRRLEVFSIPTTLRSIIALALSLFGTTACGSALIPPSPSTSDTTKSLLQDSASRRIIFVHGLNNAPESMNSIRDAAVARGYEASIVTLPGHSGTLEPVLSSEWSNTLDEELEKVSSPVTVVGFSLGALVVLDSLSRDSSRKVYRVVLLAPPLRIRPWVRLTNLFVNALPDSACLPSFAPRKFRLYSCLPAYWYRSVAELRERVTRTPTSIPDSAHISVIVAANDELIDSMGVSSWIGANGLNWSFRTLRPSSELPDTYNHYMVDPRSMGTAAWEDLVETVAPRSNRKPIR